MQQGNLSKGFKKMACEEGYSQSFHKGEFQNILYAISLGAYDGDRMQKLKQRFKGEEWRPIFNEMIRLGYFKEEDREEMRLKDQERQLNKVKYERFCFKNKKSRKEK